MIRISRFVLYFATLSAIASACAAAPPPATQPARLADWTEADFRAHGHVVRGPRGDVRQQYMVEDWQPKTLIDLRDAVFYANEGGPMAAGKLPVPWPDPAALKQLPEAAGAEKYPVSIKGRADGRRDVFVLGGRVVGVQPREIPWRLMKALYDGDGVRIESAGEMIVQGTDFENVEDAVSPRGTGYWVVRGVRGRYIRDDFVENDGLLSGEIVDCLAETYVFISARPGRQSAADAERMAKKAANPPHVKIRDCVIHVPAMSYDGDMKLDDQKYIVNGKAGGKLFKWSTNGGTVEVTNCTFRVDAIAASGPNSMGFPKGMYRDVTLVWLGEGKYPAPVPEGIKVTKDVKAWERAQAEWLKRHATDVR
jgi:hypothetical protein